MFQNFIIGIITLVIYLFIGAIVTLNYYAELLNEIDFDHERE